MCYQVSSGREGQSPTPERSAPSRALISARIGRACGRFTWPAGGLSYGVAEIVEALQGAGYDFDTIAVSGGASRSRLVRQVIADACGFRVSAPSTPEPVLLGSAMIGAAAAGWAGSKR